MTELSPRARALLEAARGADELGDEHKARLRAGVAAAVGATAAGASAAAASSAPAASLGATGSMTAVGGGAMTGGGAVVGTTAAGLGLTGKIAVVAVAAGAIGGGGYAVREIVTAPPAVVQSFDAAAERRAADAPSAVVVAGAEVVSAELAEDEVASEDVPIEELVGDDVAVDQVVGDRVVATEGERAKRATPREPAARARPRRPAAIDLASELELIDRARTELRARDPATALEALDLHRARFATGSLVQEREALRVEALCAAGRTADASVVAAEFVARWPSSPHRDRIARGCR